MSDMSHLYRAYAAVHNTEVKTELTEARNEISKMNLGQLTDADLVLVAEEVIAGFFKQDYTAAATHEWICCSLEESVAPDSSPLRKDKVRRLAEAFDTAFDKVYEKAVDVCEESFLHYMNSKPLVEKWQGKVSHEQGNQKIHNSVIAKDRQGVLEGLIKMVEGVRDLDPEKGTKERKERLEKKRGMKLDDHPEYKAEEFQASTIRKEWASAYKGIYEKKLDPVGQEDADIDNDGDVDSSDKYLHKRRKAIGKAMGKKDVKEGTMDIKGFEIPKKEQEAAAKRVKEKTAKKQASLKKEEVEQVNEAKADAGLTPLQKIRKRNKAYAMPGEKAGEQTSNRRAERSSARGEKKERGAKSAFGTMRHVGGPYKEEVQIDEVSSHLALTASQKADEERRKAAVAGDTGRAAAKAAQASRLYKGVGPRKARERMGEGVQFSAEELARIEAIVNSWDEGYQREPDQAGKKDRTHSKQPDPSKPGFTGVGNMSIAQIAKMSREIEKKQK